MTPEEKIQLILEGKTPKEIEQVAPTGVENPAVVPQIDPATGEVANPDIAAGVAPEEEEPAVSLTNPLSVDPVDPTSIETKSVQQEKVEEACDKKKEIEEAEEIVEGMKLVSKHSPEGSVHSAKVYKDADWNEYRVKFFKDGKHVGEDADYHSDDLDDAKSTADSSIEYMNNHMKESVCDELTEQSLVVRHGKVSAEAVKRVAKEMFPDTNPLTPEHFEKAKEHILKNVVKHNRMRDKLMKEETVDSIESAPELLAADANLTEEYKAKAKELFEEEVDRRVAEQVKVIQEEAEKKIVAIAEDLQKQKEAFISEMSEKIDVYLEDTSEKWIVENRRALEAKAKVEIMESFMAGVKTLYEQHNLTVPESTVDVVAEMQTKLDSIQEQMEEQSTRLQEANKTISALTQDKMIAEATEGLTKIDKVRFEKLIEEVEFTTESEYKSRIDVIREQFFQKRDQVTQNLTEDKLNMSGQPILESNESSKLNPRMQAYLNACRR